MERKIGEIFEYNGEWYQCVKQPKEFDDTVCNLCAMSKIKGCEIDECSGQYRTDRESVIFKKLEKVGNPYEYMDRFYQKYRLFFPINETVNLEIKQKQEDMEENKLNLKPFDLEAAKLGKPVCTRDGRKARIICFDMKGDICPMVAAVEENGVEYLYRYDEKGLNCYKESNEDLMMLPEKKEGWVNIYQKEQNRFPEGIFPSKDKAIESISEIGRKYIDTVKIEWNE